MLMFFRPVMPFLFLVAGCHGATYYVDANIGNDSNPGTQALPFKTINRGTGAMSAGDTLLVGPGIYPESIINNIPPGTDSSKQVTIQALNACAPPIIRPTAASGVYHVIDIETYGTSTAQYIVLNGLVIDGRNLVYKL